MTRKTRKLTAASAVVACTVCGFALRDTKATPPSQGFVSTPLA